MDLTHDNNADVAAVVMSLIQEDRDIALRPWDIALLLLIWHHLATNKDVIFTITDEVIRYLASRLDAIDGRDKQSAEKRYTDSISRLIRSECIARADMNRLAQTQDIEYQITSLGENIASWHFEHERFSGEPLTAILKAFNEHLLKIVLKAEAQDGSVHWQEDVLDQMQYVLQDMLVNLHRHQQELDRHHDRLRAFIPSLLKESSEQSIKACEEKLDQVIRTISDLQEVTLSSANSALNHLDKIESIGLSIGFPETEFICREIERRLEQITLWTTQRTSDWVEHHNVVHIFLRTVINIDRNRRITEALKQSLSLEPTWTLSVIAAPPFLRLRDDSSVTTVSRKTLRRSKKDHVCPIEIQVRDTLPDALSQILISQRSSGDIRLSQILREAFKRGAKEPSVIGYLPWLMTQMLKTGHLDNNYRAIESITPLLNVEELRIIYDIHDERFCRS